MPAKSVGEEIGHLIKDKGFPPKRAQAAALDMERRGEFGPAEALVQPATDVSPNAQLRPRADGSR